MTKLAVALLHGIGSQSPDYADAIVTRLTKLVAAKLSASEAAEADIVFKPIYWGHVLQDRENWLCECVGRSPLLNWKWLRRLIVEWLGDAIAYEPTPANHAGYDAVHQCIADQLLAFADEVGHDTPLCVIAHSFGSVIASNYFKDYQADCESKDAGDSRMCQVLRAATDHSPFARGEALAALVTLGSPIGLWALRYFGVDKPLRLPASQLAQRLPSLEGVWLNLIAPNDVLAFPLSAISEEYNRAVMDVPVQLKAGLSRWHPLSHFLYWSDDTVIRSIAATVFCICQSIVHAERQPPTVAELVAT